MVESDYLRWTYASASYHVGESAHMLMLMHTQNCESFLGCLNFLCGCIFLCLYIFQKTAGVGQLLFEMMKGVKQHFHTVSSKVSKSNEDATLSQLPVDH